MQLTEAHCERIPEALLALAAFSMMSVFAYRALQPSRILFSVTAEAKCIAGLPQIGYFVRVNLMAIEAT